MSTAKQTVTAGLEKLQQTVNGASNAKVADLEKNTKNVFDEQNRITTDYGVRQHTTGTWSTLLSTDGRSSNQWQMTGSKSIPRTRLALC